MMQAFFAPFVMSIFNPHKPKIKQKTQITIPRDGRKIRHNFWQFRENSNFFSFITKKYIQMIAKAPNIKSQYISNHFKVII